MPKATARSKSRQAASWRQVWLRRAFVVLAVAAVIALAVTVYYYVTFSHIIDARLHGERDRVLPRVFARPVELRLGQTLSDQELVGRLNDLGYAHRDRAERPGEFSAARAVVSLVPRSGPTQGRIVRVWFTAPPPPMRRKGPPPAPLPEHGVGIKQIEIAGGNPTETLTLDPPLLTALVSGNREKRRRVPLATIPDRTRQAVLAIEDRRFYTHPGVDPIRMVGALLTNVFGDKPYLVGGSTITQQLARHFFLTEELAQEAATGQRSIRRKLREQFMAMVLERRASKDEILELYLNDVYLGQRGSFAIHGVPEAARLFFGKDVSNLSLSESALVAGVIQSPGALSPFANAKRATDRRNVVLRAMADAGYVPPLDAEKASKEPLQLLARAVDNEAPYFVDLVGQTLTEQFPGVTAQPRPIEVYTTLDLNMQRAALDAVRSGLAQVDAILSRRKKKPGPAQAALIAVDPRTGDIRAMVGGRSYNSSQYNRATSARRQPGSTFKPFVYLAAFERAAEEGRSDLTPATTVVDEPYTWAYDNQVWTPSNYENEYDGEITLRRALAMSRNVATAKVGEMAGFDRVAALWKRVGVGNPPQGYPSIALGVFELTPLEVAKAYTLFTNGGAVRPLRTIDRIMSGDERVAQPKDVAPQPVARPQTTYLVTNMLRSVVNEGTGAGVRGMGFTLDAAGKTGTTNDLRDAWFVGFTPELLTVVWVGFDENTPLGLSGAQAAAPIWASFMVHALAGHPNASFAPPSGISFLEIDRDNGKLAVPGCPRVITEAFLAGTEPLEACELHRF